MSAKTSFGQWLRQRRKALDLPLDELAKHMGCATVTLYKIESGERRPSKQIAELLSQYLNIPPEDQPAFIAFARGTGNRSGDIFSRMTPHPPSNLPTPPTPLIGRELDIAAVRKGLLREDTQLLTLVGPPGIGKTRLSLATAHTVLNEFADGVFLVLLAPISDPELVARAIVQTLGILEVGPQPSWEHLKTYLRDKQMLLVLDNFEQILVAAPQVAELLAVCPFLKILATSRAPLRIRRERQFPVTALGLPDMQRLPEIETLPNYAAIELFIERAQAVKPDFSLTHENGQPVAAICRRLDGLPLAIELISARVKLLPPDVLLERLHGLLLASDGLRDLEPRHRTLNAAIGWSYDLLNEHEKVLFRRLGVFVGGWTLETAEAICQSDNSIVDGMALLLDKCLIQQKIGEQRRFVMLETIREYALERLAESGESQAIHQRHVRFFLELVETPASDQSIWLKRIEQDYDNVRAALDWCFTSDLPTGLRLAVATSGYWLVRGHLIEGRFWLEKALKACHQAGSASVSILRDVLTGAANLAHFQDDMRSMREYGESLRALGEEQQDKASTGFACFYLGMDALHRQDFGRAETIFENGLALAYQAGHDDLAGSTLLMLGNVAYFQKDYERAATFYSEGLVLQQKAGNRFVEGMLLLSLGVAREGQGRYDEARELYHQGLEIYHELDDKIELANALKYLSGLASLKSDKHEWAARLMGAAEALRDSVNAPVSPLEQPHYDEVVARLHAHLDESTISTAWAEGRLMTLEQALEYALSEE